MFPAKMRARHLVPVGVDVRDTEEFVDRQRLIDGGNILYGALRAPGFLTRRKVEIYLLGPCCVACPSIELWRCLQNGTR